MTKTAFLAAAWLAACHPIDEPWSDRSSSLGTTIGADDECPTYGCGTNSPTLGDGLIFDELDPTGHVPNRAGVVFAGARAADGTAVRLRVDRHALEADAIDGSGRIFRGAELVGMVIALEHRTKGVYEVLVDGVKERSVRFWARTPGGDDDFVPFYVMRARNAKTGTFDDLVCDNEVLSTEPGWTGVEHAAAVFRWDHYDPDTHAVTERDAADPTFNIACAATAPAKMHLLRHTRAGSMRADHSIAWDTRLDQRQAMLKMLTADYCGDGRSFTVHGHPLVYVDASHWHVPATPAGSLEAIWGPAGAVCLDRPRVVERVLVEQACGRAIPTCDGDLTDWTSRGFVYSAHP